MICDILIAPKEQTVTLPYGTESASGGRNNGFINLLTQPERINELHELKGVPELRNLIEELNSPKSEFFTCRTDSGQYWYKDPKYPQSVYPESFHTFVTIYLRFLDNDAKNDLEYYRKIASSFYYSIDPLGWDDTVQVRFIITPLFLKPLNKHSFCLDIYNHGYGDTVDDARREWRKSFKAWAEFIHGVDLRLQADTLES